MRRPDGQQACVRMIGRPVLEDGRVVRISGAIADVTGRYRNECALRQTRTELELAQKIAQIGSFSADATSGQAGWSAQLFRIFGRDPADGAPSARELLSYIHPDDAPAVLKAYEGALNGDPRAERDVRVRASDGSERIVHLIVSRDPQGSATHRDPGHIRAPCRTSRTPADAAVLHRKRRFWYSSLRH